MELHSRFSSAMRQGTAAELKVSESACTQVALRTKKRSEQQLSEKKVKHTLL